MFIIFGIASIVAFAIALILWLASMADGVVLTWQAFTLAGLLCLSVHVVTGWLPLRRG